MLVGAGAPVDRVLPVPQPLLVAAVVLDRTRDVDVEAIREFARGILTPYKVPRRVVFVDELPTNPMGKVLRKKVAEQKAAADAYAALTADQPA